MVTGFGLLVCRTLWRNRVRPSVLAIVYAAHVFVNAALLARGLQRALYGRTSSVESLVFIAALGLNLVATFASLTASVRAGLLKTTEIAAGPSQAPVSPEARFLQRADYWAELLLPTKRADDLVPTLHDLFHRHVQRYDLRRAKWLYWKDVIHAALDESLNFLSRAAGIVGKLRGAKD